MVSSAACAIAQTTKDYYQPTIKKSYENEDANNALSLHLDEEDTPSSGFQQDAGLTLRKEKHTKKSAKNLEKAYEQSAKKQKQMNKAEDRKIKKNQRAYLQESRKTSRKSA
jgi:hypothetical protein